jgi:hypothetical protein
MFPTLWWPNDENQQTSKILFFLFWPCLTIKKVFEWVEKKVWKKKQPTLVFHIWAGRNVPLSKCLPLYIFCCYFIFFDFGSVEKKKRTRDVPTLFRVWRVLAILDVIQLTGGTQSGSPTHTHTHKVVLCENVQHFFKRLDDSRISTIFPMPVVFNIGGERERKVRAI